MAEGSASRSGSRAQSRGAAESPTPTTASESARTASPVHESGASAYSHSSSIPSSSHRSHQTPTPASPQYTFGGNTPVMSPASTSGSGGHVPLALPGAGHSDSSHELPAVDEERRGSGIHSGVHGSSAEPLLAEDEDSTTDSDTPPAPTGGDNTGDRHGATATAAGGARPERSAAAETDIHSPQLLRPDSAMSHYSVTTASTDWHHGTMRSMRSERSEVSSWHFQSGDASRANRPVSPALSAAAIAVARKQRVSQAPPLPENPYHPPPTAANRPLTPTAATSLLAAAAGTINTPPLSARLSVSTVASIRSKARSRSLIGPGSSAAAAGGYEHDLPPVPTIAATAGTFGPSAGPSSAGELKAAIDAGAAPPHYAFLDQDPTARAASPSSLRGGVTTFSGSERLVRSASEGACGSNSRSVSGGSGGSGSGSGTGSSSGTSQQRNKHMSLQSQGQQSEAAYGYGTSSSMADMGDSPHGSSGSGSGSGTGSNGRSKTGTARLSSQSVNQWASFAGGPAPAWGRRESNRFSIKSLKSTRSGRSTRNGKRRSRQNGNGGGGGDEWGDDDDADLLSLMRRAAVLERLLRHGKRESNIRGDPKMVQRFSHWSIGSESVSISRRASTPYGGRRSSSASPDKQSLPRRSGSSAGRSTRSAASSLRHRLQRKLGIYAGGRGTQRGFADLGSDDDEEPDMTMDVLEDDSRTSIRTPQTPIRRAFSTSFSRRDPTPEPGAGAGVIVFPELAALPPLEPPRHDGEVCAQACLPPSVAVPYTPLPPPPEARRKSKHSKSSQGSTEGVVYPGQRSLHSLKNVRGVDEKQSAFIEGNRASIHSNTVLWGDVPTCDERIGVRNARRVRILIAVLCVLGIGIIVGLLAGLLTRRARRNG